MTTLVAIRLSCAEYIPGMLHGYMVRVVDLAEHVRVLAQMPILERCRVPGMEPGREQLIVSGGWLLLGLCDALGIERLIVSERGIRFGRLQELLQDDELLE